MSCPVQLETCTSPVLLTLFRLWLLLFTLFQKYHATSEIVFLQKQYTSRRDCSKSCESIPYSLSQTISPAFYPLNYESVDGDDSTIENRI